MFSIVYSKNWKFIQKMRLVASRNHNLAIIITIVIMIQNYPERFASGLNLSNASINVIFCSSSNMFRPVFHLATLLARTDKKVGTVPTCLRRIFSPANFNQSRCRILVFASRRANKVAKWKTGFKQDQTLSFFIHTYNFKVQAP